MIDVIHLESMITSVNSLKLINSLWFSYEVNLRGHYCEKAPSFKKLVKEEFYQRFWELSKSILNWIANITMFIKCLRNFVEMFFKSKNQ